MESFWQKAKSLAEEAKTRSQTLITSSSPVKIADLVSETTKHSLNIASKKADEFKAALADQIPSLAVTSSDAPPSDLELEKFGISQDLRDFVKGLTLSTFQNFPFPDIRGEANPTPATYTNFPVILVASSDDSASDVATVSNVRQDLSEWQQKHANLVLTTVKEVSKLRYELCPRHMKDGRFWRIYFTLVSTHVSPYERKYEENKLKQIAQAKDEKVDQTQAFGEEAIEGKLKSKTSTSEQDLDSYLLGDLDDNDDHPDDDDDGAFDDDFDKIDNSEIEDEK